MTTSLDTGAPGGAVETAKQAGGTAAEGAKAVVADAAGQAKEVVATARDQLRRVTDQARSELTSTAEQQGERLAGGLQSLSQQLEALVQGRHDQAGALPDHLAELQGKISQLAERVQQGGAHGVVDDLTNFARRRPGVFLAGAVGAGFTIGRLVRAAAAERSDDSAASDATPATGTMAPVEPSAPITGPVD